MRICFDLDETLGEFIYLSQIWNDANSQISNLNQVHFNYLCALFPEFFRPYIFEILNYLVENKRFDDKIVIYTNNNGEKSWTNHIKNYIEYRIGRKVFDDVICAYKVNGRIIEPKRTSYEKIYRKDFKYNYFILIKYNYFKPKKNKGSAIFIHLTKNYKPTAGCIALSKKDFLIFAKIVKKNTSIAIY